MEHRLLEPATSVPRRSGSPIIALIFGLISFGFGGLGLTVFIITGIQVVQGWSWKETPCRLISIQDVRESRMWRTKVCYEYEYEGKNYRGSRYRFWDKGCSEKQSIPENHQPNAMIFCYVNPKDPKESVIIRGFTWPMLFVLIPLVFFIIGAIVILSVIMDWRDRCHQKK